MSISRAHKQVFAGLLCLTLLAAAGCGDKQKPADVPSSGQRLVTPPTTGSTSAADPRESQSKPSSEADLVPVDVALKNGKFASSTPKVIHIPSDFLVLITVTADNKGPYSLSVLSPSTAQTYKIESGTTQKITQDGLAPGKQIKLMLGDKTVRVVADAEPGP